jgi:hypothetical protein
MEQAAIGVSTVWTAAAITSAAASISTIRAAAVCAASAIGACAI